MERSTTKELFFDPFAEAGEELFDPLTAHASMWERYQNREVEHDYTADNFLADTQAIMMDAQFLGRFDAAQSIAANMHAMCNHDQALAQSLQNNESTASYLNSFSSHDGHSHGSHGEHEDDDETDSKTGKKKSKVKLSWFGLSR